MPKRREAKGEKPRQTWQQQLEIAKALTVAYGGKLPPAMKPLEKEEIVRILGEGS